jgi:integrase
MLQTRKLTDRTLCSGDVVLFKRKSSAIWQARIKRYSGNWLDITTKENDFDKAKQAAEKQYHYMRYLQDEGKVDVTKKFESVATQTIRELQAELDSGIGKTVYKDYIRAINNYLIPSFKSVYIHKIDTKQILRLEQFRLEKIGHTPNRSTINTHNAALNKVFKTAVNKGFMLSLQVPDLPNNGSKPKSRPYFDKAEYREVYTNLRAFAKTGHQNKTKEIRELLRDYVLILTNTGMRCGTESLNIRWNNIRQIKVNDNYMIDEYGAEALQIAVDGKTGKRTLIARDYQNSVTTPLLRIAKRFSELKGLSFEQLIKHNEKVFRLSSGSVPEMERLSKAFITFLKQNDLHKNIEGDGRSLYSLRHTYATFQILDGLDMETLAVQMGTSVGMLEKHYSKLKPYMKSKLLSGQTVSERKQNKHSEVDLLKEEIAALKKQLNLKQSSFNNTDT